MEIRFRHALITAVLSWFVAPAMAVETIDILFVYDTTATTWVANNGGQEAFNLDVINRMNLAAENSGLDVIYNAVHSVAVAYTTTSTPSVSLSGDLSALRQGNPGLENVANLRTEHGADLVAMLIDHGSAYGYTGVGYLLDSYSGNPDYGLSVNAIRSVEISHTLTHEVGHNLGAGHAKNQASGPGPGSLEAYAAGYYFTGVSSTAYHTVMAYNSDGYGGSYTSSPLFSNPLITYDGVLAGDSVDADNARLFQSTIPIVASYRMTPMELAENQLHSGLSGSAGQSDFFYVDISEDVASLTVRTSGGTGDLDLYVRLGAFPSITEYDCRADASGNNAECEFVPASPGRYAIMVTGYANYAGASLEVVSSYGLRALVPADPLENISGAPGSFRQFYVDVPSDRENLTFTLLHGTGNADLYVRYGSQATTVEFDCAQQADLVDEVCSFTAPPAGRYYVMVYGDEWFGNAALNVEIGAEQVTSGLPSWGGWRSIMAQP